MQRAWCLGDGWNRRCRPPKVSSAKGVGYTGIPEAVLILFQLLVSIASAADCRQPAHIANEVEEYVSAFSLEYVPEALESAEVSFGCSTVAAPATLARIWLAEGITALYQEDSERASLALGAARRTAPAVWFDGYDPAHREIWEKAAKIGEEPGTLEFMVGGRGLWTAVDGALVELPVGLEPGLHLVQTGLVGSDTAAHARFVVIEAGKKLDIDPGVRAIDSPTVEPVATAPVVLPPAPEEPGGKSSKAGLATAGVLAATTAALLFASTRQRDAFSATIEDSEPFDAATAYGQHRKSLVFTGAAAATGAAALGVGVGAVLSTSF